MSRSAPVSVRLNAALNKRINAIATALDRPKSWVIEQAVAEFVSLQEWHLTALDAGIAAADASRVVSHDDVTAWVRSWGRRGERPLPKCG